MNGVSKNNNPTTETFLLNTRFLDRPSLAILFDSVRTQEYYEASCVIYDNKHFEKDYVFFSADNNMPVLVSPTALFYPNNLEYYRGDVLAISIRGAINAMESGCCFEKKTWFISDVSDFKNISTVLPYLVKFFDEIVFINKFLKDVFGTVFNIIDESKMSVGSLKDLIERKNEKR